MSCGFLMFNPFLSSCDWPSNAIRVRQECGSTFSYFSTEKSSENAKNAKDMTTFATNAVVMTTTAATTTTTTTLKPDVVATSSQLSYPEPDFGVAGTPLIFAKNEPQKLMPSPKMPRKMLTTG